MTQTESRKSTTRARSVRRKPALLAILGYSSAVILNGHKWTPAGLDDVAERIIQEGLHSPNSELGHCLFQVRAEQFYAPTLSHLNASLHWIALAKITLAISHRERRRIIPGFLRALLLRRPKSFRSQMKSRDSQRWSPSRERERVIESDRTRSQVQIRVPLTASAIREHGYMIRQDATVALKALSNRTES